MKFGVDLAKYQNPFALPYPAWIADGLEVVVVQVTHGLELEPVAEEHLAVAAAARVPHIAAYHWLKHGSGTAQAQLFLAHSPGWIEFSVLDVEEEGVTAADVIYFCAYHESATARPLVLYGNNALAAILSAHPELRRFAVWYAGYPTFPNPCRLPPYPAPRNVPASLQGIVGAWQYAGDNGVWEPFRAPIDRSVWYEIPGVSATMPAVMVPRGSLVGIHAIEPGDTLKQVVQAVKDGAPWAAVKQLNDAAAAMQYKIASPSTWVYLRYFNPADDSLQGLDEWSPDNEDEWCIRVLYKIYSQITAEQCRYVDWACAWNEEDPPGKWGYKKLGETFLKLGRMNEARKAAGLTYVKLAFGCLAQGTPELWEIDQLVDTGLFAWMHDHFYSWDVHEGAFAWQTIDEGYQSAMPSTPEIAALGPGHGDVPAIPGSGSGSFRFVWTFERRLRPLGQLVPLLIGEWYPGVPGQLDRYWWYDDRLSQFEYVTGFACYNFGPTPDWPDLTADFTAPAFVNHRVGKRDRINGGLMPTNVADADLNALHDHHDAEGVILAKYPRVSLWRVGDVAIAVANPLQLYDGAHNATGLPRPNYFVDQTVLAVSADGNWLKVFASPEYWVRAADVRHK